MNRAFRGPSQGLLGNAPYQGQRSAPLLGSSPNRGPMGGPNMGTPGMGGPNMGGINMGSAGGMGMSGPNRMNMQNMNQNMNLGLSRAGGSFAAMGGSASNQNSQLGLVSELLKNVVSAASAAANQLNNQPMESNYSGGQGPVPGRPMNEGLLGGPPSNRHVPDLMSVQSGTSAPRGLLSPPMNTIPQGPRPLLGGPGGQRMFGQQQRMNVPHRQGALLPSPGNKTGSYGVGNYGNRNHKQRYHQGGNRQQSNQRNDSSEEYDPANPTEDDYDSPSRQGNKRSSSFGDGGPQAKRRNGDNFGESTTAAVDGKYPCRLCNQSYNTIAEFDAHMRSEAHRATNEAYKRMHAQQTEQQIQRMRASQHLKNVENDDSESMCKICVKRLVVPYQQHYRLPDHKHKAKLVKKGCILCKTGSFADYEQYKAHIDLDSHKKAKDELNRSKLSKDEGGEKQAKEKSENGSTANTDNGEITNNAEAKTVPENDIKSERKDDSKLEDTEPKASEPERDEPEAEVQGDILYDPDVPVGQDHVIPVKGFFCKLCHKFYKSEELAKNAHCKSEKHFEKYQEFVISQQQENDSATLTEKIDAPSMVETKNTPLDKTDKTKVNNETKETTNDSAEKKESNSSISQSQSDRRPQEKIPTARRGRRR